MHLQTHFSTKIIEHSTKPVKKASDLSLCTNYMKFILNKQKYKTYFCFSLSNIQTQSSKVILITH